MALMRSPDGSETVEVPDNEVAHYESLGATLVQDAQADATAAGGGINLRDYAIPAAAIGAGVAAVGARPAARLSARAIERLAGAPVLRRLPGASNVRGMAGDIRGLLSESIPPIAPPEPESAPPEATRGKPVRPSRGAAKELPASLVKLTKADISAHKEFKNFKPGDTVRRVTYEKVKMGAAPAPARPSRTPAVERVPIDVPGKPQASRAATQRGASGPVLARRATEMAGGRVSSPFMRTPEMLEAEAAVARQTAAKYGLKNISGPALQVLLAILDAQSIPEQMQQAQEETQRAFAEQYDSPSTRRALLERNLLQGGF